MAGEAPPRSGEARHDFRLLPCKVAVGRHVNDEGADASLPFRLRERQRRNTYRALPLCLGIQAILNLRERQHQLSPYDSVGTDSGRTSRRSPTKARAAIRARQSSMWSAHVFLQAEAGGGALFCLAERRARRRRQPPEAGAAVASRALGRRRSPRRAAVAKRAAGAEAPGAEDGRGYSTSVPRGHSADGGNTAFGLGERVCPCARWAEAWAMRAHGRVREVTVRPPAARLLLHRWGR